MGMVGVVLSLFIIRGDWSIALSPSSMELVLWSPCLLSSSSDEEDMELCELI